ncbi:MAG: transporter substrate-binding domain-containing protein, partial [Prochlorothrix sp.]
MPSSSSLQLTTEELDYRRANPVLRVHGEENWPPYNFMEEWELKGLSNDYLRLLAKQAGFQLEFVPGSWDQSMQRLAEGEIDVISNMKITPDRQKQFLFSAQPVFEVQTALLARSDQGEVTRLEQLEGKTLAVVRGYFHEELLRKHYPNIQLLLTANTLDAMRQVDAGRADAAIETHAVFNYYIQRYFLRDLV